MYPKEVGSPQAGFVVGKTTEPTGTVGVYEKEMIHAQRNKNQNEGIKLQLGGKEATASRQNKIAQRNVYP